MDMRAYMERAKRQTVKKHHILNSYAKKGQIVLAGSSLMEQFPINEMLQSLDKRYIVYNRGIGGDVMAGQLDRMAETFWELEPSKIFINIGTNDISGPGYSREKLLADYAEILRQIKERLPGARVWLLAYYPVNIEFAKAQMSGAPAMPGRDPSKPFGARDNDELRAVNAAVEKLASDFGCGFIDLFTPLLDAEGNLPSEYTVDGMHMYPNGYKVVLDILLPFFEQ